jgi:hypothetical protein
MDHKSRSREVDRRFDVTQPLAGIERLSLGKSMFNKGLRLVIGGWRLMRRSPSGLPLGLGTSGQPVEAFAGPNRPLVNS